MTVEAWEAYTGEKWDETDDWDQEQDVPWLLCRADRAGFHADDPNDF